MSKLGLSLKISVPKSKTIPKPSVKIEAKNKKGRVILEDEEYKVLLAKPKIEGSTKYCISANMEEITANIITIEIYLLIYFFKSCVL